MPPAKGKQIQDVTLVAYSLTCWIRPNYGQTYYFPDKAGFVNVSYVKAVYFSYVTCFKP